MQKQNAVKSKECKYKTELSHSVKTNLFDFKMFIILRSYGSFDVNVLRDSLDTIKAHTKLNITMLLLIALTPKFILSFFLNRTDS